MLGLTGVRRVFMPGVFAGNRDTFTMPHTRARGDPDASLGRREGPTGARVPVRASGTDAKRGFSGQRRS